MTTEYHIYIVNHSISPHLFWAFLSKPEISSTPEVFANSNTNLQIPAGSSNLNSFTIPVQYVVGTGASNNAVGLDTRIESSATRNTEEKQLWDVVYATVPPNQGPEMTGPTDANQTIDMKTESFNPETNAAYGWFESMSFGIKTSHGFMGVTWTPSQGITYKITPKLTFYIAIGNYSSSSLADITAISNDSAICDSEKDFDAINQCTVTYDATGSWTTAKGRPSAEMLNSAREIMLSSLK
jgi:hypothetical protein